MNKLSTFWPYVFFLILLIMVACKSKKTAMADQPTEKLLLLLTDNTKANQLPMLKDYPVKKMKRTSRSQNLWTIDLVIAPEDLKNLMQELNDLPQVKSVKRPSATENSTYKNSRKAVSRPGGKKGG